MNFTTQLVALLLLASWKPTELPVPSQTTPVESAQAPAGLEDVSWSLTWLGAQRLTISASRPAPTLVLSGADRRVTGNSGCNELSGEYQLDSAALRFGPIVVTRRVCTDPVLNQRENLLLRALNDTRAWQLNDNTLILTGPRGQLARFERKSHTPD